MEESPREQKNEISRDTSHTKFFPLINDTHVYDERWEKPEPVLNTITHYMRNVGPKEQREKFVLKKQIGDIHYVLSLSEYYDKIYSFDFKTDEYEYAYTQLSWNEQNQLLETCAQFIREASSAADNLQKIRGWGAPAAYTRSEIDECKEAILASPANTLSANEVQELKGKDVFDAYSNFYGKEFPLKSSRSDWSASTKRASVFSAIAQEILMDWEVDESQLRSGEIYLSRKKDENMGSSIV